jgi:agmatine deiminase
MVATIDSTPRADGFRMPGEFEVHVGTWMLWPQRSDVWRLGAKPAQRAWVELATTIARFEPVTVGVNHDQFLNARGRLPPHIRVLELSSDDVWIRDSGPSFLVNEEGEVRAVDWHFNSWGQIGLAAWDRDDMVARKICEVEGVDRCRAPLVMEGGSFHVDGEGTVLTTEECLLNPNRNPQLSKQQIEHYLFEYLNAETIIWLGRGLDPDVTSGHVDDVAFFVRPGVVAVAWTDDPSDHRREILVENYERLRSVTDARERRLKIHKIPLPAEVVITEEEASGIDVVEGTLPLEAGFSQAAAYINLYLCNGAVIMPTFDDPCDETARRALQGLFPERTVAPVPSREIILAGGNIHCVTQQVPLGSR